MEIGKFSEHIVENEEEVKDVVATNKDKKLEAAEDLVQHCAISVEREKFSEEHIVENEEEVKNVVATNDDKNIKQKKILISIVISQWKWKSSVNILWKMRKEEVKDVIPTNEDKKLEAEEDLDHHCDISIKVDDNFYAFVKF